MESNESFEGSLLRIENRAGRALIRLPIFTLLSAMALTLLEASGSIVLLSTTRVPD